MIYGHRIKKKMKRIWLVNNDSERCDQGIEIVKIMERLEIVNKIWSVNKDNVKSMDSV